MLDLKIEQLGLSIEHGAGHEHRLRPITLRAVALLAERLDARMGTGKEKVKSQDMQSLSATPVSVDLGQMSDEQAAGAIADAWLEALALKIGV